MKVRRVRSRGDVFLADGYSLAGVWATDHCLAWSSEPDLYFTHDQALKVAREAKAGLLRGETTLHRDSLRRQCFLSP